MQSLLWALPLQELARKRRKIPLEEYQDGPEGLKYYDIVVGGGAEARVGERVAIHYDVKWRNVTFATSRQGMGVTGGNPLGFDVGQPAGSAGSTLAGIDVVRPALLENARESLLQRQHSVFTGSAAHLSSCVPFPLTRFSVLQVLVGHLAARKS